MKHARSGNILLFEADEIQNRKLSQNDCNDSFAEIIVDRAMPARTVDVATKLYGTGTPLLHVLVPPLVCSSLGRYLLCCSYNMMVTSIPLFEKRLATAAVVTVVSGSTLANERSAPSVLELSVIT